MKSRRKPSWLCCESGRNNISDQQQHRDWKHLLPGLVISAISLAVVLYLAKPGKLYEALRLADLRLILLGIVTALSWIAIRALAWRTLLQNKAGYSQVFFTVSEGYLLNNILPFRLGEIARAFLLSHKSNLSFWEVFSTIIIERVIDLAIAAGLLLITVPFIAGASWARQASLVSMGVMALGLIGLYLLARNRSWALARFDILAKRWPALLRFGGKSLNSFFDGLAVITDGRRFFLAFSLILLNWFMAIVQYYWFLLAFIPQAKFIWAAFILGAAALGMAAPSSPGALGVFELTVVGALAIFGIDAATALAVALALHLTQYLMVGVLGTIGLARDGQSLIGLYARLRSVTPESAS